jgi:hypothetical protein
LQHQHVHGLEPLRELRDLVLRAERHAVVRQRYVHEHVQRGFCELQQHASVQRLQRVDDDDDQLQRLRPRVQHDDEHGALVQRHDVQLHVLGRSLGLQRGDRTEHRRLRVRAPTVRRQRVRLGVGVSEHDALDR